MREGRIRRKVQALHSVHVRSVPASHRIRILTDHITGWMGRGRQKGPEARGKLLPFLTIPIGRCTGWTRRKVYSLLDSDGRVRRKQQAPFRSIPFCCTSRSAKEDLKVLIGRWGGVGKEGRERRSKLHSVNGHSFPVSPDIGPWPAACMFLRTTSPEAALLAVQLHGPCDHRLQSGGSQCALQACLYEVVRSLLRLLPEVCFHDCPSARPVLTDRQTVN